MQDNISAEEWYARLDAWQHECRALRQILRDQGLHETMKWRQPCYTDRDRNIALVSWRADGALVSLFRGVHLDDPQSRLQQAGSIREARYLSFPDMAAVRRDRAYLRDLVEQAIAAERAGKRLPPRTEELDLVPELRARMAADDALRDAFEALTKGRQRQYNLHFEKAKKAATRESRIDKATERILVGKGLTDCICGRTKRQPRCDGSHRRP